MPPTGPRSQPVLPGLAPLCPHCGDRRGPVLVSDDDSDAVVISAERWECRACDGVFWSIAPPAVRAGR